MTHKISAVDFPGQRRLHVALEVSDLDAAVRFYTLLLGEGPTKTRPGYAKFEPADPSVNLALNHAPGRPRADQRGAAHYGVQVKSTDAVVAATRRFAEAGYPIQTQDEVSCCYAVQDKVWVTDPDGQRWEVFVVLDANVPFYTAEQGQSPCCSADSACCSTESTPCSADSACAVAHGCQTS